MPVLTVVLPCFRSESYIVGCLDSILSYPGLDLEVVAIDDCSPDRTAELLLARVRQDPRLRVHRLPERGGPGPARNVGIEHASGTYVWFVDADDMLPPDAIDVVVRELRDRRPEILIVDHAEVFGDVRVARRTADSVGTVTERLTLVDRPELLRLAQSPCTKIVQRRLLDEAKLRFPPGRYEDALYSPLLLMAATDIVVLDRVCYLYRQATPGSTTSSPGLWHFDIFDQYERLFAAVSAGGDRLERFRPDLFRVMLDHYLVVLGHRTRLSGPQRRPFFRRMVCDFNRFRPAQGYPRPVGVPRLKHDLVRMGVYPAYAALRWLYRTLLRSGAF